MNLNEQLQQAYEAGRRQALDEQFQGPRQLRYYYPTTPSGKVGVLPRVNTGLKPVSPWQGWKKVDFWKEFMRLRNLGTAAGNTEAGRVLQHMISRGFITQQTATQLTNALTQIANGTYQGGAVALRTLLGSLGLSAVAIAIIVGAIVAPGFAGLTTISPNIPQNTLKARYPKSQNPAALQNPMVPQP